MARDAALIAIETFIPLRDEKGDQPYPTIFGYFSSATPVSDENHTCRLPRDDRAGRLFDIDPAASTMDTGSQGANQAGTGRNVAALASIPQPRTKKITICEGNRMPPNLYNLPS